MPGAIPTNLHEGSRTEYLAQYFFASFGTAVSVPQQEDIGFDIYCTLTQKIGQLSWPRAYFAVQVKSNFDPWVFASAEEVRWLVEYPLPLFLCVIDKKIGRIRVYYTSPRFFIWSSPPLPNRLELVPTTEVDGLGDTWSISNIFSLSPVIDVSLEDLQQGEIQKNVRELLRYWIDIDLANLRRIKAGIEYCEMPYRYRANEKGRCAMLLRHLFKDDFSGLTHDFHLQSAINEVVLNGLSTYVFEGVDALNAEVDRMLRPKKPKRARTAKKLGPKKPSPKKPSRSTG